MGVWNLGLENAGAFLVYSMEVLLTIAFLLLFEEM